MTLILNLILVLTLVLTLILPLMPLTMKVISCKSSIWVMIIRIVRILGIVIAMTIMTVITIRMVPVIRPEISIRSWIFNVHSVDIVIAAGLVRRCWVSAEHDLDVGTF